MRAQAARLLSPPMVSRKDIFLSYTGFLHLHYQTNAAIRLCKVTSKAYTLTRCPSANAIPYIVHEGRARDAVVIGACHYVLTAPDLFICIQWPPVQSGVDSLNALGAVTDASVVANRSTSK